MASPNLGQGSPITCLILVEKFNPKQRKKKNFKEKRKKEKQNKKDKKKKLTKCLVSCPCPEWKQTQDFLIFKGWRAEG
jgi:hypothetical protein